MREALSVGARALDRKDELVLRSLVKLLDGGARRLRLRFEDDASRCDVLFVTGRPAPAAPGARQVEVVQGLPQDELADGAPLRVPAPLRLGSVSAALEAVWRHARDAARNEPPPGVLALFHAIAEPLARKERRRAVLSLGGGTELGLDFERRSLHGAADLATLAAGRYVVGLERRVAAADEAWLRDAPALRLHDVLWALARELARVEARERPLPGSFRLLRWPDAAGLAQPGHPRIAALLTSRAMSCDELVRSAGCTPATAHWFLATSLALGIAVAADPGTRTDAPAPAAAAAPAIGLLGRLRERLRLW